MGQLLHCIRDLKPIPAPRVHHISLWDVRHAVRDAAHPTFGPRLTALSAAPLVRVNCRHGKPADWLLAGARKAPWITSTGILSCAVPASQ